MNTDSSGSFETAWSIAAGERAGVNFVVSAESLSGAKDQAAFDRIGRITLGAVDVTALGH